MGNVKSDAVTSETNISPTLAAPQPQDASSSTVPTLVTFGTYNYKHPEILEDATGQAIYLMKHYKQPPLIDTAMKYNNLSSILKVMGENSDACIGWKVEHSPRATSARNIEMTINGLDTEWRGSKGKSMHASIAFLKENAPNAKIFRILMHNYCGKKSYLEFQHLVEQEFGADMPIGICNVSAEQLEDLINPYSSGGETAAGDESVSQRARVDWVQNEYHPFLETRVPDICRKYGISFEAHSVMTNIAEYAGLFEKVGLSSTVVSESKSAELALKYAAKQGGVCFATTDFAHLKQDLETLLNYQSDPQDEELLSAMSQFSSFKRIVHYKGAETSRNVSWITSCDPVQIRSEILPKLKHDIALFEAGKIPSNLCVQIPKSFRPGGDVHAIVAEMMYGEDLETQMVELRQKLLQRIRKKASFVEGEQKETSDAEESITDEDLKKRLEARWSCQLNLLLKKMRLRITTAKAAKKAGSKKSPMPVDAVEQPKALPMNGYPKAEEFSEFVQFLRTGGELPVVGGDSPEARTVVEDLPTNIRFKYGTINNDGRLDMCKQGFRNAFVETCDAVIKDGARAELPVNIRFKYGTMNSDGRLDMCKQGFRNAFCDTCEAVIQDKQNAANGKPLIEHYLIGNNLIAEDEGVPGEGDRRVAALARMIRHRPDIVTWFLAGNSMDSKQIQCVAEALEQTRAKYVWLKMNPVKTGSYYLGKMLLANPHIELLDLFNCGLCNEGVAAFTQGLEDGASLNDSSHSNFRHLYLSINAITSARDLEKMLSFMPHLESLFLGVNPIGDEEFKEFADAMVHKVSCRHTLRRLNVGSMGLTEVSLPVIKNIVKACPKLVSLELESYKSTEFFAQKHNRFDIGKPGTRDQLEGIARALVHNASILEGIDENTETPLMQYLGLQHALMLRASPGDRTVIEAKRIIDDFVENQMHRRTGININGITNLFFFRGAETSYFHIGEKRELKLARSDEENDSVKDNGVVDGSGCGGVGSGDVGGGGAVVAGGGVDVDGGGSSGTGGGRKTRVTAGRMFFLPGVTRDDLRTGVRHPWPAVDHIKSIYRNTMKV